MQSKIPIILYDKAILTENIRRSFGEQEQMSQDKDWISIAIKASCSNSALGSKLAPTLESLLRTRLITHAFKGGEIGSTAQQLLSELENDGAK